jgi:hypothetical protein
MLISHVSKFIYLKTRKTAGTSVEIYFEPYCMPPKERSGDCHNRTARVSEWGVVGSRGSADRPWYNHQPAAEIRELVGGAVWESYYKFCVIRNPFDKVVSHFWHELKPEVREEFRRVDFSTVRGTFDAWTGLRRFPADAQIYTIDGEPAVDGYIRWERLWEDLRGVCNTLELPWQPQRLGRYKSEYRKRPERFEDYYTREAASRVEDAFAWEFEYFGYPRYSALYKAPLPRSST